jgi:uncharacterized protein (DUF2225 family)
MEVKALRHKLDNEIRGSERKIEKLKKEHRLKIEKLSAESQQKLEHAAKTYKLSLKLANEQIRESVSKISQLEIAIAIATSDKRKLEDEKDSLRDKVQKLEKAKSKESARWEAERQQLENDREGRECTLCMERHWDTALPCGHCYCSVCSKLLCSQKCPTCDKATRGKFIKLFNCRK